MPGKAKLMKSNQKQWEPTLNLDKARAVGPGISVLEFQDRSGEWHDFEILATHSRIVFGGYCNAGFLESGYIEREDCETIGDTLSELLDDLKTYYNDGPQYVSRIVCNERM